MAATLAHIKSKMLLPAPPAGSGGRRLEEQARSARGAGPSPARVPEVQGGRGGPGPPGFPGRDVLRRAAPRPTEVPPLERSASWRERGLGLQADRVARHACSKNLKPEKQHEVRIERVSITDAISRLAERLRAEPRIPFSSMFEGVRKRHQVISTFLGLLEMVRLKLVRVVQEDPDSEIDILATDRLGDDDADIRDDFR